MNATLVRTVRTGVVMTLALVTLLVPGSLAQTPEGQATPIVGDNPHPAHIHSGTCADLGDIVAPLTDVVDPVTGTGTYVGPDTAQAVEVSSSIVDLPLEDIIANDHAINVHLSADKMDDYIACGDIGGVVVTDYDERGELNIGLRALNGSGYVGTAWLGADGDQTKVEIILFKPDELS